MRRRQQPVKSIVGGTFGTKAVTLGEFDNFLDWLVSQSGGASSASELYSAVSWVFWCINRRANAIGQMPYGIYPLTVEDDDPDAEVKDFIDLRPMLWQVEAWLCLVGAAYVLKQMPDDLPVLNAYTMSVKEYDAKSGPTLFEQRVNGQIQTYRADELLYFRLWHPHDDINAGVPSSTPGKVPAQVVKQTSEWADAFFKNGAIPAVLLTTEGSPPPKERDRIESAWTQMLQGVSNAFKTIVLGHGLTPTVIGQPVSDLAMPDLERIKREQILGSFLLPPGLAEAKTNRAERDALKAEAYEECYIPEAETWIEPVVNEQLLTPMGLRLSFQYQQIEVLQARELEKAEAMAFAIQGVALPSFEKKLMTPKEVRSWIDSVGQAANLPALDATFVYEEPEPPPQLAPFTGQQPQEETPEGGPTPMDERIEQRTGKALADELDKWERKAVTRILEGHWRKALEFKSDVIPFLVYTSIVKALELCTSIRDVKEVFEAARGTDFSKQLQFIPEGQGDPLPPVPAEVTFSDADIDRAIRSWNRLMPEFEGLLDADVTHRENYEGV